MKKISEIVLIICVAVGLMASTANEKEKSSLCQNQDRVLKSDTSGNRQLVQVDPFNLNILPPSSGVQYYRDGIVFLSSTKSEGKMLPGHISFGTIDAYYAIVEDTILGNHSVFSPSVSFAYPCEALTFNSDYNTMYFTKFSETDGGEKIYQANYISGSGTQGEWSTDLQPLAFCAGKSTYTHPALSADGGIMIFASDMTASLGGMDLFLTRKDGERWSDPVNLGAAINTKSNELFPFLDSKNNLFFSSDGQPGLGGYDVFMCKFNGKTWNMPINLTKYINTEDDDVAFTVSRKDGNSAFYTTKVKSGKRAMQLKRVTLNNKLVLNNLASLSDVFTSMALSDKASPEMIIAAVTEPVRIIPVKSETKTEVIKKENDVKGQQKINPVEIKKEDRSVEIPVKTVSKPEKKQVPTSGTQVKPADAKVETIKVAVPEPAEKKDVVVYRIQIISSGTAKGNYQITINGKSYSTFEYFYNGGYRTCVGKFSTLASATELQRICRKSGYAQAFIVAFKNNVRSTDPALFK